jgi:putative beta-lysine N-acetyltransferase
MAYRIHVTAVRDCPAAEVREKFEGVLGPGFAEVSVEEHETIRRLALSKTPVQTSLPEGYVATAAETSDAPELAALMARVFPDYPTPTDAAHLEKLLRTRANLFALVRDSGGTLVAAMSAELDSARKSAEMTDCATLPEFRGRGLMAFLLQVLEQELAGTLGIVDLYTIARADNAGVNCAFAKLGYQYTGRLINNCRMPNGWESMNVWCKTGRPAEAPNHRGVDD